MRSAGESTSSARLSFPRLYPFPRQTLSTPTHHVLLQFLKAYCNPRLQQLHSVEVDRVRLGYVHISKKVKRYAQETSGSLFGGWLRSPVRVQNGRLSSSWCRKMFPRDNLRKSDNGANLEARSIFDVLLRLAWYSNCASHLVY